MSLDQNLFTLIFTPNKDHTNVTDLVDPSGIVHYHKRRITGQEYKLEVFDPLSESLLITATAPAASSKVKILELHNPSCVVELKYTGTLTFKWGFKWEEHEFEWKREQCFLIRKPDPPVLVAVTKEQSRQVKNAQVQILDYNLRRFDIDDRKGLEIIILTALMTFHDSKDAVDTPSTPTSEQPTPLTSNPGLPRRVSEIVSFNTEAPPPTPPKPAPRLGLDRIVEMQAMKGEDYNEITVEDEGTVQDYGQYCSDLLSDDAMLFISVKSAAPEFVPKVLQVVEETKRIRYKAGLDDDTELHQYVLYDTEKKKGPKRINLNDDAEQKAKYAPPESLIVHLSKIDIPDLQPKSQGGTASRDKQKDDRKVTTSSSAPSSKHALPKPPSPPLPTPSPATPSSSFFKSSSKERQAKNKLTKSSKDRPTSTLPPPSQPTGIFNSHPPAQSSGPLSVSFPPNQHAPPPSFPVPHGNNHKGNGGRGWGGGSGSGYETPGLSMYNHTMPHIPGPPPPHQAPLPPPPPPQQKSSYGRNDTPSASGSNRPLSTVGGIADTVVSGIFGMVKNASSQVRK